MKSYKALLASILAVIKSNRLLTAIAVVFSILAIYKLGKVFGTSFYDLFLK